MKTKEKTSFKLIFILLFYFMFTWMFSACQNTYAVTINGTVEDENGSPIEGIHVESGSGITDTNSSGFYEIDATESTITYSFQGEDEYEEEGKAIIETYSLKEEAKNQKFNIFIVVPEGSNEAEFQEIKQILNNCNKENEKIIKYTVEGFKDESGNTISDPYEEYKKACGINHTKKAYTSLFIVIGNSDMPVINTKQEPGDLSDGNIFLNTNAETKLPKYMQINNFFDEMKEDICNYAGIEKEEKEFKISVNSSNAKITLDEPVKSQRIRLILKRQEKVEPPGDFISGCVFIDGVQLKKSDYNKYLKQGEEGKKIKVRLVGNGSIVEQEVTDDGEFGFIKPDEGDYYLEFIYNGQEFKVEDEVANISNVTTQTDNNYGVEVERDNFNNRFKNINNDIAKKIMNYDESLVNIFAITEKFKVLDDIAPTLEDPDGYEDPKKYLNLRLKTREEFDIEFKKEIDVVKVTLADGQIYKEKLSKNHGDEGTEEQVSIRQIIMDEELMHGATIEIEYLITAKTKNDIEIEEIKIIDYLDYKNSKMEYVPNKKLLTDESKKNEDYNWEFKQNKDELSDMEQSLLDNDEESEGLKEREYLIGTMEKQPDGTFETRLVVSKLISSNLEEEDLIWSNSTEIIVYSNNEGRRLKWENEADLKETDKNIPGNLSPKYIDEERNYITNKSVDMSKAEDVFIIPPFGRENKLFINLNKYIEQKNKFFNKEDIRI